uniref:Spermatosis associated 6 n=1 Tax=Cyanistes caeruleus TaxID=156563 RepID=A0A8C0USL1_CYACU
MSVLLLQITCPGVLLKDKQELYLGVFVLGQYNKTECVPAVFPLFFQERLVFEKAFANIVDPGDLMKLLEFDTAVLELIQLVPPVGKVLATYEENTRDFLFPDPKLTHGHRGLVREILMKRSPSFTVGQPSPGIKLHPWCSLRESAEEAWPKAPHDPSPLNSYRPRKTEAKSTSGKGLDSSALCKEDVSPDPSNRESHSAASLERSAPPAGQEPSPSSVLNRSSLRERFSTGWPSPANGDEIHKRVKNILRTHSARQRLVFDDLPQTREPPSVYVPLTMSELQSRVFKDGVTQYGLPTMKTYELWSTPNKFLAYLFSSTASITTGMGECPKQQEKMLQLAVLRL